MSPKAAIFFFLLAAGITLAILIPARGRAERIHISGADCTLGTCPTSLNAEDDGGNFTYYSGDVIHLTANEPPQVFCLPDGALQALATSALPGPGAYDLRAQKRGICSLRFDGNALDISVAVFR